MLLVDGYEESKKLDYYIKNVFSSITNPVGILGIIQIGDNASSTKYISVKQRVGDKLSIKTQLFKFEENLPDAQLAENIRNIVTNKEITGLIIQLPLPRKSLYSLLDLIPLEKDVDLLSSVAQKRFYDGTLGYGTPVTRATEYVLDTMKFVPKKSKVLIIGNGFLVGKPIAQMLKFKKCDVIVTENFIKSDGLNKDLVILSAGIPNLVSGEDFSDNTNVIDFGSTVIDGKTYGDLDMGSKLDHLGWVVPSPKGMGPLVVRFLFLNHLHHFQ